MLKWNIAKYRVVIVAQLAERCFLPEVRGSVPVIIKIYIEYLFTVVKGENKEKEAGNGLFTTLLK